MRAMMLVMALVACAPAAEKTQAPTAEAPAAAATAEAALAATPSWELARAAGIDFRAVGQEPGWILDIYTQARMRLMWDYGESSAEFPLAQPTYPQEGATRYDAQTESHRLAVTIRRFPCQDAMSGAPYPATVEVVIDGRTLQGCGKSV